MWYNQCTKIHLDLNFSTIRGGEFVKNDSYRHFSAESTFIPPKHAKGFVERDYKIDLHTQDFYEVNIVISGSSGHTVGSTRFKVSRGDVFIIPPYMPHSYDGGRGFNVYHLLLSPRYLEKNSAELQLLRAYSMLFMIDPMMRKSGTARLYFRLSESQIDDISPILDSLARHTERNSAEDSIIANSEALIVVAKLCAVYETMDTGSIYQSNDDKYFAESIAYIYENYSSHVSIDTLIKIARMSRTAYITKFKRVTGETPGRFQTKYRIEIAKQRLSSTSDPISSIATETGFCDAAHFTRTFGAEVGVSPSKYRERTF